MTIKTSYKQRITNHEYNSVLKATVMIYSDAVKYLIDVVNNEWDDIKELTSKKAMMYIEKQIHKTSKNLDPKYDFDSKFYKFPSYLRRNAIATAIGKIKSYKSNLVNWEETNKTTKKTKFPKINIEYPVFYKGNMFKEDCKIKVFKNNDWVWITLTFKKSDTDYINRHCSTCKKLSPKLVKNNKNWCLVFSFEEDIKLTDKKDTILAVDLGINNACVCSVMTKDGTILKRKFLKLGKEIDSLRYRRNKIKQAHQRGNKRTPRLWHFANGRNKHISMLTANFISNVAKENNVDVIVFERLDLNNKKHGTNKEKLHLWKARNVQKMVEIKAHKLGIRISRVCAWNTSKLAYDGSGPVSRHLNNYSMCTFANGKIYNCDLSASYNIGARYFIREILKSLPEKGRLAVLAKVPELATRSRCTLSSLINLTAELV